MTTKENEAQANYNSRLKLRKVLSDAVHAALGECQGEDIQAELNRMNWTFNAYITELALKKFKEENHEH